MNYATSRTVARLAPPRSSLSSSAAIKSSQERGRCTQALKKSRIQEEQIVSRRNSHRTILECLSSFTASQKWATNDNQMEIVLSAFCMLFFVTGGELMEVKAIDHCKVLTDATHNASVKEWKLTSVDVGGDASAANWSITKRILSGGRQEGVEVIDVDNGALKFTVVPTRGFNVWTASVGELRLGWDSPVKEIVHPQYVNLAERGGLGWLNGFGEWVSRCGLESMGAPCKDGNLILTLHGRINYIPASYVEVRFESNPAPRIVLRGIIDETLMFGPQLRLTTEISTEIGKHSLAFDDTVTNLADAPQEMESLYHINFGPPLLGAGAQFVAPVKKVAPRDPRAAER